MLSPVQKAKLLRSNSNMGVYLILREFEKDYIKRTAELDRRYEKKTEELMAKAEETFKEVRAMKKGDKPIAGVDYHIPKDGETPTKTELVALIKPLIPQMKDGKTPTKRELLDLIEPLVPKAVDRQDIVRTVLSQLKQPDVPTADAIAEMALAKLKERKITLADIEGLQKILSVMSRNISAAKQKKGGGGGGGGGMGNFFPELIGTGDGVTTAFPLTYKVASSGKAALILLNGQTQEYTTHYTINNTTKRVNFTTAPFDGAAIYAWYVRT